MNSEKYNCSCGETLFQISEGSIKCVSCQCEYRVSGFPTPARFNAERDRYIKFDKYSETLKK